MDLEQLVEGMGRVTCPYIANGTASERWQGLRMIDEVPGRIGHPWGRSLFAVGKCGAQRIGSTADRALRTDHRFDDSRSVTPQMRRTAVESRPSPFVAGSAVEYGVESPDACRHINSQRCDWAISR